ncbi:MAG TPA: 2-amino-4-hydroxy-6-hydroxymethyldihydropteridine diphosphokinase [Candidatus Eisenbacteria bacterium]|nr:2-amino-4-hydroxy-6-hydroxymethyldihydropteridine diphosphokinase [Candidatus Eisenbacteria bacterium]
MTTVYLALGTNLGEREENLRSALRYISDVSANVRRVSSVYETEPVDYLDQDWFFNIVLEAETELRPLELLRTVRGIETRMGSRKAFVKGPRLIDLDILLYGMSSVETPDLQIPHPRMLDRKFVLVPLVEIAPALRHPAWSADVTQLLAASRDQSQVKKLLDASSIWTP